MKHFISAISAVLFLTSSLSSLSASELPFFHNNECCGYGELQGDSHFKIYGDYLYWQVSQDQMAYAAVLPG